MLQLRPTQDDFNGSVRQRRRSQSTRGFQSPRTTPVERLLLQLLGPETRLRVEVYDGTSIGPDNVSTTIRIVSPEFFRQIILGRASELSFGRCYVAGYVEIEGDIYEALRLRDRVGSLPLDRNLIRDAMPVLGVQNLRDLARMRIAAPPPEEVRLSGRLHSRQRDSRAISSHYDVSNQFYQLFLDPTMTYSCAVFDYDDQGLQAAQANKYDLICSKLGLQKGQRLLDIGCGWGGMAIHAAHNYGVQVIGVTISEEQQRLAKRRVADAGLASQVQIRLQDYRDITDIPFDAISSIGMFEHVGQEQLTSYFEQLSSLLVPGGRLLNHAINRSVRQDHARVDPNGFIARYVFPDGTLLEPGQVVSAINSSGLEVRHLESLREHYAKTLRTWVGRLEDNWDQAVRLTSVGRAKVWKLYMAVSALGFESNEFNLTQILATKTTNGNSDMDLRPHW